MNGSESLILGLGVLIGAPLLLWALGAKLIEGLGDLGPAERLGLSVLAGLSIFLASASVVNLLLPLSGAALILLFTPMLPTVIKPSVWLSAAADVRATFRGGRACVLIAAIVGFLLLLLWPLLVRPGVIYYDGTANHDGFFWITGAEYLQRFTYLTPVVVSDIHPFLNGVRALTGWMPGFGRIGAEAYVATVAGLAQEAPLKVYLWASASLYLTWIAAVYVTARTFIGGALTLGSLVLLGASQPIFAFYHHNANLPNLLGALCGATVLIATTRGVRECENRSGFPFRWGMLGLLGAHGLLATYPEMAPFVALPCGLIVARACIRLPRGPLRTRALCFTALVGLGACLINPATTARAASGFATAFLAGRTDTTWANIFAETDIAGLVPALVLLSPKAGKELGPIFGWLFTVGILAAFTFAWWRAKDRGGLAIAFAGVGCLALYTAVTGFSYGWQKTIQFAGVLFAAVLPFGAALVFERANSRRARLVLGAIFVFAIYGAVVIQLELGKWSGRKQLHSDWLKLGRIESPVFVDPATFEQPFFHGMWVSYFLRHVPLVFPDAEGHSVGYLINTVSTTQDSLVRPEMRLVARKWAEREATDAQFLMEGETYRVLVRNPPRSSIEPRRK